MTGQPKELTPADLREIDELKLKLVSAVTRLFIVAGARSTFEAIRVGCRKMPTDEGAAG